MEEKLVRWWLSKPEITEFKIKSQGYLNLTDGPDIYQSELIIDEMHYSGNIEIDVLKSSWFSHGHFKSMRFQDTLLHIYKVDNNYDYTEGYVPRFSYCLDSKCLTKNHSVNHDKLKRLDNLITHFEEEDVFWLLLARTLGHYYNKDLMMSFAYDYLVKGIFQTNIKGFSKSVRPNNRIERRIKQFMLLKQSPGFYQECKRIMMQRYFYIDMLNKQLEHFNAVLGAQYHLEKKRIIQFISYYFIPLLIKKENPINENMIFYLKEQLYASEQENIIKKYA